MGTHRIELELRCANTHTLHQNTSTFGIACVNDQRFFTTFPGRNRSVCYANAARNGWKVGWFDHVAVCPVCVVRRNSVWKLRMKRWLRILPRVTCSVFFAVTEDALQHRKRLLVTESDMYTHLQEQQSLFPVCELALPQSTSEERVAWLLECVETSEQSLTSPQPNCLALICTLPLEQSGVFVKRVKRLHGGLYAIQDPI